MGVTNTRFGAISDMMMYVRVTLCRGRRVLTHGRGAHHKTIRSLAPTYYL